MRMKSKTNTEAELPAFKALCARARFRRYHFELATQTHSVIARLGLCVALGLRLMKGCGVLSRRMACSYARSLHQALHQ
jgi:hypothetical protein